MPSGYVVLKIPKDKERPRIDQIFNSLQKAKTLKIKAGVVEPRQWRPDGKNFYEIKITSINLIDSRPYYRDYKATATLIGMNGVEGEFPECFCWPLGDEERKHEVLLFFTTYNEMSFQYEEYITL